MNKFEVVSAYADKGINIPTRATYAAAGYDFEVAEDIVIPSYHVLMEAINNEHADIVSIDAETGRINYCPITLDEMKKVTSKLKAKPTLVPTGMKCKLEPGTYLELSVRSSTPLKYWLVLANSVGIIDADYYNNPDNEGEIFFQMIILSPYNIILRKGDIIGQGIIKPYLTTEDDNASGQRTGGFGSTSV